MKERMGDSLTSVNGKSIYRHTGVGIGLQMGNSMQIMSFWKHKG